MTKPAMFQTAFSLDEFHKRRQRVCESIGNATAVIQGAAPTGAMDRFRQHNDFFYLCGVEVPNAYLTIDGRTRESSLYLIAQDPRVAEEMGHELNSADVDTAHRLTGIRNIKPVSALEADLSGCVTLYVCHRAAEGRQACQDSINAALKRFSQDPWRIRPSQESQFIDLLKNRCEPTEIKDLSPIVIELRKNKSAAEIDMMRIAGKITGLATAEAIRSTQPGLLEGDLASVADFVFLANGAVGGGYRPIIASGENIWNYHYFRNDSILTAGDLVLFDYAPDVCNYTSDIGRMWPVDGIYRPWQKELYGLIVDYHLLLLDIVKPGMTPIEVREKAAAKLGPIVAKTRWSRPGFAKAAEELLATSRSLTHSVGMAVHDESGYQDDETPLVPGCVFALDPQLWIPEERHYIRVEDCVAVTDSGLENLTPNVPHSWQDIEQLMKEPGLFQQRPDLMFATDKTRI